MQRRPAALLPGPTTDTGPADTAADTGGDATTDVDLDVSADAPTDAPTTDTSTDTPATDAPTPDVPQVDAIPDLPEPDVEPDADPDVPPGPCVVGTECDDGGFCAYDTDGCGFDPVCVEFCPPTTPVNVCSCGGVVAEDVPGYSTTEFAYVLDNIDQRRDLVGAECDPAEPGRLLYTAVVRIDGLDAGFTGTTLYIRVPSNWDDSYVIGEAITVTDGFSEVTFPFSLDPDLFGWSFQWYLDFDLNGRCDFEFEFAWETFVSNPFGPGPVEVELDLSDEPWTDLCESWHDGP